MWAPEWRSNNHLDGRRRHLCLWHRHVGIEFPTVFSSRRACRKFIEKHYGYIRNRRDLQQEPHGWRIPQAVKVKVKIEKHKGGAR